MPEPARTGPSRALMLPWLCGWTLVVAPFNILIGTTAFQQVWAFTWPAADGVVVRSGVQTRDVNRLSIAYEYEVDGRTYTGTRYSYGEVGTDTRHWHKVAAELPAGTPVTVRYDPADPAESLLQPGLNGFVLSMIWFLTPFNIIAVGGWVWFLNSRPFDPGRRRCVRTIRGGYRVKLPGYSRAGCGAALVLIVTFFGSFVWAFGFTFTPPPELAGWLYVVLVAVAAGLSAWLPSPPTRMDVDTRRGVIRFPPDPTKLPFSSIRGVVVRHEEKPDSQSGVTHEYHCEFVRADSDPYHVATFGDCRSAEALAAWLRERLGLKADAGVEPLVGTDAAPIPVPGG
jgi:hypothetical protein